MVRHIVLAFALAGGLFCHLGMDLRGDDIGTIECQIGDRIFKMRLTGSAIRTKSIFKIYAVDSYVERGLKVRSAQDMIAADQPKQLHLVMLRDVAGPNMADAFTTVLRSNHPEPEFDKEVNTVANILRSQTALKGEEIWFTHIPKVGFQCKTSGGKTHLVANVEFSKAVWENYFGKHNVGEKVKQGLLSRLEKE
jgi:hypothetical protein